MPFNSRAFKQFSNQWDFTVTTSSPRYPQSNGLVERNVKTIKSLFRKAREGGNDEQMVLLEFRNTQITGMDKSPSELIMSRRLRSNLPMTGKMLKPAVPENIRTKLNHRQQRQKSIYDRTAKLLPKLKTGDAVRYQKGHVWKPAVVVGKHSSPRSYKIMTDTGTTLRRNRRHLRRTREAPPPALLDFDDFLCDDDTPPLGSESPANDSPVVPQVTGPTESRTRSGRIVRPPLRFRDD